MKQMIRAAALSVTIAGTLSAGLSMSTVSASERNVATVKADKFSVIPPQCGPGREDGCGIYK